MSATVLFRVDASSVIGTGHVMRCLTLADALRRSEINSTFISRDLGGNLCDLISERGFEVRRLSKPRDQIERASGKCNITDPSTWLGTTWEIDATESSEKLLELGDHVDWLVVDHYSLDRQWERRIRPLVRRIMVIDDLANRSHECDLVLDQNYYEDLNTRYDKLVPANCTKLLGPKYALLREEFLHARSHARVRSGQIKRILIFLGGSDPENITARVLSVFTTLGTSGILLDVVVGASNPHKTAIRDICNELPIATFHCQVTNMSELMLSADLAIGAGGTTTWERCALGLPTLTIVIAENQLRTTQDMSGLGVIWYLGRASELDDKAMQVAIQTALNSPERLRSMSAKAIEFMSQLPDESGAAVTAHLLKEILHVN